MQKVWDAYVQHVRSLCSTQFWKMYNTVKEQTAECADKVMRQAREILRHEKLSFKIGHNWPTSSRGLRDRIRFHAGCFWPNVTHTKIIHVPFLPKPKTLSFKFLDPCYVWIQQCRHLSESGHQLEWTPKILRHRDTHEELYGAGIQYGLLFRAAKSSIPRQGDVALMNLSWDGGDTGIGSRSASPICIQVMNTNAGVKETVGLVGYIPSLEVSDACRSQEQHKVASFHVLQV